MCLTYCYSSSLKASLRMQNISITPAIIEKARTHSHWLLDLLVHLEPLPTGTVCCQSVMSDIWREENFDVVALVSIYLSQALFSTVILGSSSSAKEHERNSLLTVHCHALAHLRNGSCTLCSKEFYLVKIKSSICQKE